ncbi:metallophosphoesterase [Jannaschia faecimaris]|nr:metallophosphoesterase [Jannaschia faecimaris]
MGDIHGCYDLLMEALHRIDTDMVRVGLAAEVLLLGDYVDRGPQSAKVLKMVSSLAALCPVPLTSLMGNHERMLLDFIDDPKHSGERWLRNGGRATLASYRIDEENPEFAAARLVEAMPPGLLDWLRNLPLLWRSGNLVGVHAGADPLVPIKDQKRDVLLWGCTDFERTPRTDGLWVVHGHTIVPEPQMRDGRIALDTGAYATGRLTVARIDPGAEGLILL